MDVIYEVIFFILEAVEEFLAISLRSMSESKVAVDDVHWDLAVGLACEKRNQV